eukprot:TRINITY_DN938_c0_g6_i1.p2 TRINITY_DN938_c0_g6~~TRINITY_DN938_c0_g6_i1.p2  ORF type:complete len:250 (-),score=-20.64 TRINITY_DN938_c0_g6_i1:1693-2409(-)
MPFIYKIVKSWKIFQQYHSNTNQIQNQLQQFIWLLLIVLSFQKQLIRKPLTSHTQKQIILKKIVQIFTSTQLLIIHKLNSQPTIANFLFLLFLSKIHNEQIFVNKLYQSSSFKTLYVSYIISDTYYLQLLHTVIIRPQYSSYSNYSTVIFFILIISKHIFKKTLLLLLNNNNQGFFYVWILCKQYEFLKVHLLGKYRCAKTAYFQRKVGRDQNYLLQVKFCLVFQCVPMKESYIQNQF